MKTIIHYPIKIAVHEQISSLMLVIKHSHPMFQNISGCGNKLLSIIAFTPQDIFMRSKGGIGFRKHPFLIIKIVSDCHNCSLLYAIFRQYHYILLVRTFQYFLVLSLINYTIFSSILQPKVDLGKP